MKYNSNFNTSNSMLQSGPKGRRQLFHIILVLFILPSPMTTSQPNEIITQARTEEKVKQYDMYPIVSATDRQTWKTLLPNSLVACPDCQGWSRDKQLICTTVCACVKRPLHFRWDAGPAVRLTTVGGAGGASM